MLKNPIPEIALFYDLEWVPDSACARTLYDLPEETEELEAMQQLWENAHGYDAATNPRPFIKYLFSRVVAVSFLSRRQIYRDGERTLEFGLHSLPKLPIDEHPASEGEIIQQFLYFIGRRRPQLVGYNSAESDLQVLIQRGMVNEIQAREFCSRPEKNWDPGDYFKRWDNEDHLDLMKLFSGRFGMTPRLDEFAKLCGYPGKLDVHGDQVTDLWLSGDLTRIVEYNQIDVINTYLLWLRVVFFCGKMTEEEYSVEQEQLREFLEAEAERPEKAFLGAFLSKWPE